jgi:hypothetical protein
VLYATKDLSFIPVNHCPGGPFFRRGSHFDNDVVGAGGGSQNSSGRESAPLPRIIFGEFSFTIIDMDSDSGVLHIGPHAKPVIVSLKEGVFDGLLLSQAEITAPLIIADNKPLFDVRIHRLERTPDGVVQSRIRRRQERAKAQKK